MPDELKLNLPSAQRQLSFHQLLIAARKEVLGEALKKTLARIDPDTISKELSEYAPSEARQILAESGIRDEMVFVTPSILKADPALLGYYRLLLGVSKKIFYTADTGLTRFARMEQMAVITEWHEAHLHELCLAMNTVLSDLVVQISPRITSQDINELPLLTLGSQFQGSNNNVLGQAAAREVFLALKDVFEGRVEEETDRGIEFTNSNGVPTRVVLSADPDVSVEQKVGDEWKLVIAIEIKGGTDRSNAHNRAGEAEKSHQKVKGKTDHIWTLITMKGLSLDQLKVESPTTKEWFDIAHILSRDGADWGRFRDRLVSIVQ
jgi:XcyI restriction endonuclease